MIRKLAIAVAAVAALGTASLTASTPAAAGGKGGGFHHHHHGFHGFRMYAGPAYIVDSCYRRVWRVNRFGEAYLKTIYVCD